MHITGAVQIAAPVDVAWGRLADIASHVDWMTDAESIRFTSAATTGVGTTFDCVTKVGPLSTVDKMTVVEWVDGRVLAVEHKGTVVGTGRFALNPSGDGCELRWTENLRFPWFVGGVVTTWLARPVLRWIWMGNLRRFARLCEGSHRS